MLFNSWSFLIFFPVVSGLYFVLPQRWRWLVLLLASCIFYAAFIPVYLLILFGTIVVDYVAGLLIAGAATPERKKCYLLLSIISNVGVLVWFKYYYFIAENAVALGHLLHWQYTLPVLAVALPIGLSFHTFQAMSYTIEVYRGKQPVEKHLGIYALYVMFFPQLVAGPIERPQHMLHQFYEKHLFDRLRIMAGVRLMLWGFFKKMVIADNLALVVNEVYRAPHHFSAPLLLIGTVFFAIQIYADFSGYCDIAIGAAHVLGFRLTKNFNQPYSAQSIGDFWRRWHISLSSWFRDYVYIPLGGNQRGSIRQAFNLMVVFLLSGLWHGASWNFVAWGALHGLYLVFSLVTKNIRPFFTSLFKLRRWPWLQAGYRVMITVGLVTCSWVFFRAATWTDAGYIFSHLWARFVSLFTTPKQLLTDPSARVLLTWPIYQSLVAAAFMVYVEASDFYSMTSTRWTGLPFWVRCLIVDSLLLWIFLFGYFGEQVFIYFQF